ncbi:MAG: sugar ABC transporter substrate-binding protein, partial [Ignavibacteriales bacterium]|nr:sugar ABC transporter substrate-binding protein [Ignavibacteriales bacterium]
QKPDNEIEFWTLQLSPVFNTYIQSVIAQYEKQHPGIKIKWMDIPYDAAIQKLQAAYIAGKPPDVVNLSSDFLAKFAGMEALLQLEDYIPAKELKAIYHAGALDDCTYMGKVVALPWYLNTYCLLFNKDLLQKAGMDSAGLPKTFDEAVQFIRVYKQKTGKFATGWNIGKNSYLPMMLGSEGIEMVDSSLQYPFLDNPELLGKLAYWIQLYKQGYLPGESIINSGSAIIEAYQSGQVAWVLTGPVFLRRVKDNAPDVYKVTGVAPPLTGKTGFHELATMAIAVTAKCRNPKTATDFARFLTNADNQLEFCKLATIFPSTKSSLENSYFTTEDGTLETFARVTGARLLPGARRLRYYLKHPRFDELNESFDEGIQTACLNSGSTGQAMQIVNNQWKNILRKK